MQTHDGVTMDYKKNEIMLSFPTKYEFFLWFPTDFIYSSL